MERASADHPRHRSGGGLQSAVARSLLSTSRLDLAVGDAILRLRLSTWEVPRSPAWLPSQSLTSTS